MAERLLVQAIRNAFENICLPFEQLLTNVFEKLTDLLSFIPRLRLQIYNHGPQVLYLAANRLR